LIGFGLAALVTLATDESGALADPVVAVAAGFWISSSILLLFVLVAAEWTRRSGSGSGGIGTQLRADSQLVERCGLLLWVFIIALVGTSLGVALVAFHFSTVHGAIAVATVLAVIIGSVAFFRGGG
jgi:hypothetical protein